MTQLKFDICPKCGSHPQMGLRCHPKFSVAYVADDGEDLHLCQAYFHTEEDADLFCKLAPFKVLYRQSWNHQSKEWDEYP